MKGETLWLHASVLAAEATCPSCSVVSGRVHSRYQRHLSDPAIGGRATLICLRTRRFFCDNSECPKKTLRRASRRSHRAARPPEPAVAWPAGSDRAGLGRPPRPADDPPVGHRGVPVDAASRKSSVLLDHPPQVGIPSGVANTLVDPPDPPSAVSDSLRMVEGLDALAGGRGGSARASPTRLVDLRDRPGTSVLTAKPSAPISTATGSPGSGPARHRC